LGSTDKTAVVVVGDTHIGSTVGLCLPVANLDDGGTYSASQGQRWLWRSWLDFWTFTTGITQGCKRVLVLNGDIVEKDNKRRTHQIITRNDATLLRIAVSTLKPALEWADAIYVVRGTEAHTGKSAEMEEALAYDIGAEKDGELHSHWHLRAVAGGVRMDIAHHATMGGMPWTERNAAIKLAAITWHRYMEMGKPLPHVVVRNHVHRYADSGGNYETFAVMAPAWSLATSYLYRIGKENDLATIGGLIFICENGQYQMLKKIYRPRVTAWDRVM